MLRRLLLHSLRCRNIRNASSAYQPSDSSKSLLQLWTSRTDHTLPDPSGSTESVNTAVGQSRAACSWLHAFSKHCMWDKLQEVVDYMHRNAIQPTVWSYSALVTAYSESRQWEKLARLQQEMLAAGVELNHVVLNQLIAAYAQMPSTQAIEHLLVCWQTLQEMGLDVPTDRTVSRIQRSCCLLVIAFARHKRWEEFEAVRNWFEENLPPDERFYRALVGVYAQHDKFEEMAAVYNTLQEQGAATDPVLMRNMLISSTRHRDEHQLRKVWDTFQQTAPKFANEKDIKSFSTAMTVVMHAFVRRGWWVELNQTLELMHVAGLQLASQHLNTLIVALKKANETEKTKLLHTLEQLPIGGSTLAAVVPVVHWAQLHKYNAGGGEDLAAELEAMWNKLKGITLHVSEEKNLREGEKSQLANELHFAWSVMVQLAAQFGNLALVQDLAMWLLVDQEEVLVGNKRTQKWALKTLERVLRGNGCEAQASRITTFLQGG